MTHFFKWYSTENILPEEDLVLIVTTIDGLYEYNVARYVKKKNKFLTSTNFVSPDKVIAWTYIPKLKGKKYKLRSYVSAKDNSFL